MHTQSSYLICLTLPSFSFLSIGFKHQTEISGSEKAKIQSASWSINFPLRCLRFHQCSFPLQAGSYCALLSWPTGRAWGTGQNNSGDDFGACCTAGKSSDLVKEMGGTHSDASSGNRRWPSGELPKTLPSLGLPKHTALSQRPVFAHSHSGMIPDCQANHLCATAGASLEASPEDRPTSKLREVTQSFVFHQHSPYW